MNDFIQVVMMTKTIDVQDSKLRLNELLLMVESGTEIILTSGDEPRARVIPFTSLKYRIAGLHQGAISVSDDFNDPLPVEYWQGEE